MREGERQRERERERGRERERERERETERELEREHGGFNASVLRQSSETTDGTESVFSMSAAYKCIYVYISVFKDRYFSDEWKILQHFYMKNILHHIFSLLSQLTRMYKTKPKTAKTSNALMHFKLFRSCGLLVVSYPLIVKNYDENKLLCKL